jgi:pSer/pThr/pTyr-binding forkhead associated (FHA) protein
MASAQLSRPVATKIAKWLVARSRREEAVAILCAAASLGANDAEGQALIGEALGLEPGSALAKSAIARMEGKAGEAPELDAAIARYDAAAIEQLEKEVSRPQFMRAQVGFNNNIKYKDRPYHVQTEDSGLMMPHIITHLFADGGRVIKSHKRSYKEHVDRPDVPAFVRSLMKAQHMEMVLALREGTFDEIIAGKARGGMTELTEPPQVDMQELASRKKAKAEEGAAAEAKAPESARAAAPPAPAIAPPKPSAPVFMRWRVLRSTYGGPEVYEPPGDAVVIGRSGGVPLEGERFCHPSEGVLRARDGEIWVEDLEGGNGIFLRIRRPAELDVGDEFVVGDQVLRVERNPEPSHGPDPGPTYMWVSPHWASAFRIVQVLVGGIPGEERMAGGSTIQIGRTIGDMVFPNDPRVADRHCFVEEQAGVIVLTDLMSATGTFARIRGEQRLFHGDELLIGRTVLRLEVPGYNQR